MAMGLTDWEIVTNYMDSVSTTLKTFTFNKPQDYVKVTNRGSASVTYTIGTQSGTIAAGSFVTVSEVVSSFTLQAASGTQSIEVYAKEKGTEKQEDMVTTTFNSDGSITESYANGSTKTTTFNSDGSITEIYSTPINKTKTTTFNADGSITEVVN